MTRFWFPAGLLLLALSGCTSTAVQEASEAKNAKRVAIHTELGAKYLSRNQLDVALQELERALDLSSSDSQANNLMALLQLRLKNYEKAEQHFRRSISEGPENSDARNNYGVFLCERDRIDDADEQFRAALKNRLYQSPDQANTNAGICQLKKSNKAAAQEYFRSALQSNPQQPVALINMARLSFENGDVLPARGFIQRYLDLVSDSPDTLLLAFRIERALGDKDAQASYALRLRGKFPDSIEAKQLRSLTGK